MAGASRGIGLATAKTFAAEGANVAICARGQEGVDAAVSQIDAAGSGKTIGTAVDLTNADAISAWIENAANTFGGCDIMIPMASAGGGAHASEESWQKNFEVDLLSTFRCIEAAMPHLEQSDSASIIVLGTTAALEEFAGPQSMNSMKAALINYASNLSRSVAPKGIRVNTISPGPIQIPGGAWDYIQANLPDFYNAIHASIPTGRLGNAEEVANLIVFAASSAAPFLTGANIVIDGAMTQRVQY
ncbi:MAG: SDR family oxidoreductase [Pseudomonadota bacterium]